MQRIKLLIFCIGLFGWELGEASSRVIEEVKYKSGKIVVLDHKYISGNTLDFFKDQKLVYTYEPRNPTARVNFDVSKKITVGKNEYYFTVWNSGIRSQILVVHDLASDGKVLLEQGSHHEIYFKMVGNKALITYVDYKSEKNEDSDLEVKQVELELKK